MERCKFDDYTGFEGEFLNGEFNGNIKEYESYISETLKFNVEYKDGKKNGKGKEFIIA